MSAANPTVEPELQALVPDTIGVYATRLFHAAARIEDRLAHYIRHLPDTIRTFGGMDISAFGFACAGASFIAGLDIEDELTEKAASEFDLPVITAAQAIRLSLKSRGVSRLALVSPGSPHLEENGLRYWRDAGFEVVSRVRVGRGIDDLRRALELTNDDTLQALRELDQSGADCIVISGTGLPSLRALGTLRKETTLPLVSGNLALAWALTRAMAPELAPFSPIELLA
jgi:maleate isomerase